MKCKRKTWRDAEINNNVLYIVFRSFTDNDYLVFSGHFLTI